MPTCHGQTLGAADPAALPVVVEVLLVGNPNCGKSTLFNTMTGSRQRVMNAPGTTVELQRGVWVTPAGAVRVTDLPGTYSLNARSPDEQVVVDALSPTSAPASSRPADAERVALVVLDATALPRSLYLLGQVGLRDIPVVVAVTMTDVATTHGGAPDLARLAVALGTPVIPLDPRKDTAEVLGRAVAGGGARHLRGLVPATAGQEAEHLFSWVEEVLVGVVEAPSPRRTRTDVVDRALLSTWIGLPAFLAAMWLLFQLATSASAPAMSLVNRLVTGPASSAAHAVLAGRTPAWVEGFLVDGVLAGVATVLTFVPVMAIVHTAIALLEDSGYLARAAFLADRAMGAIGLDGRAMLPLIIGFGCNVPALAATRTLPDARQRLLTGLLVPWTSCTARLTVYILLAQIFFPDHAGTAIFSMYVLSIVLIVGGGAVLRCTAFRSVPREPLMLVLPAYQRPRVRPIARAVGLRVQAFVVKAGRIVVATLALVWVLTAFPAGQQGTFADVPIEASLYGRLAASVAPVFEPAGFGEWHLTAALGTGFVAKEVVVGALAQSYAIEAPGSASADGELGERLQATFDASSGGHGGAAAFAFMVFVLGYTPCLATVAEQWRRFGWRWTSAAAAAQVCTAWALAVVAFQVGRLL